MKKFLLILLSLSISSLINSCSSNVRAPEKELEIKNTYGKTGFMDQVQAANNKLDCVAAIATDINDCIQTNGSWELVIPELTTCEGFTITEKLGLFNWTCSVIGGKATLRSTMKNTTSLASFLEPGAFKLNSLTIKDRDGNILATTRESTWFTDKVQLLPVSTSGTEPIMLDKAGIFTFGPSSTTILSNMVVSTKDKTAIVGLQDAVLKFNDGCYNTGLPGYPDFCSTVILAGDFNYIEGQFVSPPADQTKLNFTILTGGKLPDFATFIRFSEFKNIEIIKNPIGTGWGTDEEPNGIFLAGEFHSVKGTLTGYGMHVLGIGTEKSVISANIIGGNSHESIINISGGSYNTITGTINISNTEHSPFHIKGDNNIISSNIILNNAEFGGLTLNDSIGNLFTGNITVSNVLGGQIELLNGSNNNTFSGVISVSSDGSATTKGIDISYNDGNGGMGNPSNSNNFSGTLNISNCATGVSIQGSDNNILTGITNIHDVNLGVYISGAAELNRLTGLKMGTNIGSFDVFLTEDLLLESPTNNEVKSYNLNPFASCGTPANVPNNDTSCP